MNDQAEEAVNSITDSIVDMVDNTDPQNSAVMNTEEPETEPEAPEAEPEKEPESQSKKTIKWQGKEVEIEPDKEVELLQKGYDYTQKTQELSRLKSELAPIEGLAKQIQSDPKLAQYIAGYFQQKVVEEPKKPQFDDPIEELKWNIKQETIEEVRKSLVQPLQEQNQMMSHKQRLDATRSQVQADPMYQKVQEKIVAYVQSLPPKLQHTTYLQLDQDPDAYQEAYSHFRKQLETNAPPVNTVKKEERAPILESAGKAPEVTGDTKKTERVAKAKAKALSSGDPSALADWLLQSGAIDHLT